MKTLVLVILVLLSFNVNAQELIEVTMNKQNGVKIPLTLFSFEKDREECYSLTISREGVCLKVVENLTLESPQEGWDYVFLLRTCEGDTKFLVSKREGRFWIRDDLVGRLQIIKFTGIYPRA